MSALRSLRQLSLSSSRTVAARSALTNPARFGRLPTLVARVTVPATRTFSVSARSFAEGSSDVVLAQKLAEELQYEKAATEGTAEPDFLKSFKEEGVWTIEDTAGHDEVALTRQFGNEKIRLMFSIADIQNQEEDPAFEEDSAPEEDAEADEPIQSYGIRVAFSLTKANGPGAISVDTVCQDGSFMVDNISFYKDAKIGTELSADADWKRRGLYIGPQFDTLDVQVQEEFEKYLQERGVNESLALFIPEYAEYKEQKEYVKWLESVKSFIDL